MKKIILSLSLLVFAFNLQAQNLDDIFDKYSEKDGFSVVYITQSMMDFFKDIEVDASEAEIKDMQDAISGLENVKVLSYNGTNNRGNFENEVTSALKNFEELMIVKEKGQTVKIMMQRQGNIVKDLVIFVNGTDEIAFVRVKGEIDMNKISKLSKYMNIDNFEHLENIDK